MLLYGRSWPLALTPFSAAAFLLAGRFDRWCLQADFKTSFAQECCSLPIGRQVSQDGVFKSIFGSVLHRMLLASYWLAGLKRWCLQAVFRAVLHEIHSNSQGGPLRAKAV